jgi:hypothetical protein
MISILSLHNITRRPGAVLGGGPSLMKDLKRVPPGAVMISVNYHALQLVRAECLVFMDDSRRYRAMLEATLNYRGIKVSPLREWTDVDLSGADWWHGNFSSHLATWLACFLGCDPVLLCGMDCYQGERSADADPRDNAYNTPLVEHLKGWQEALQKCPNADRIKAVSGPLTQLFGKYQVLT